MVEVIVKKIKESKLEEEVYKDYVVEVKYYEFDIIVFDEDDKFKYKLKKIGSEIKIDKFIEKGKYQRLEFFKQKMFLDFLERALAKRMQVELVSGSDETVLAKDAIIGDIGDEENLKTILEKEE